MKIRAKLVVAFMVIMLGPILLTMLCVFIITYSRFNTVKEAYGIKDTSYEALTDSTQLFYNLTQAIYERLDQQAKEAPEMFEDIMVLNNLNIQLLEKYSFLTVRKGDEIIYNGGGERLTEIERDLPKYGQYRQSAESGIYVGGETTYLIRQIDFMASDGMGSSLYITTQIEELVPEIRVMLEEIFLAIVIILGTTASLMTGWIYRSIVRPIRLLQVATENITKGNLDFVIETPAKDEIGELCMDFEEMRKRLKESAEERVGYDKGSKELISNISHDLKTPITAIKGYVEGIMDGVADTPEKMEKYIKTIYNKANDMEHLIDELTFYSKIDTNKIPYNFKKIDLDQYFRDCVEEMSMDLEASQIELTYFNYIEQPITIIADPEQLKKVMNNIIGNSVKYIGNKRGVINIRVLDAGDFVQIEIEDNGKGIAVRDLPYIFDRFYRTDASRNSSQGGSGIGLSIVRKIIEDHGGKIWATSKENTGTVMNIVFRKYQEEF